LENIVSRHIKEDKSLEKDIVTYSRIGENLRIVGNMIEMILPSCCFSSRFDNPKFIVIHWNVILEYTFVISLHQFSITPKVAMSVIAESRW